MIYKTVFSRLIIYCAAIALLVVIAGLLFPAITSFQDFTWLSFLFFSLLTALTLYIGLRGLEKSSYGFVASVNGIVLLKLMLSVVLVLVYVIVTRPKEPQFILPFFLFYILFTVFEVRELLLAQKAKSKDKN
ncbi:MAG: hypothetical protein KBF32_02325 [Chitinophagales bacterium]|jgi:hypothetical protein|nr:hypothetical protein [Chitinophagaceae bacterium]MBP9882210.1 hypothetical protein [Chitinophagales bacterium]